MSRIRIVNFDKIATEMINQFGSDTDSIKFIKEWIANRAELKVRDPSEVLKIVQRDLQEDEASGYKWTRREKLEQISIVNLFIVLLSLGYYIGEDILINGVKI